MFEPQQGKQGPEKSGQEAEEGAVTSGAQRISPQMWAVANAGLWGVEAEPCGGGIGREVGGDSCTQHSLTGVRKAAQFLF